MVSSTFNKFLKRKFIKLKNVFFVLIDKIINLLGKQNLNKCEIRTMGKKL